MNKRVYGVLGISSVMANWNADFSGFPKTTSDGETFGSDKALKYPMKKMWDNEGKKVLYIKSMKLSEAGKKGEIFLIPKSLRERYEFLYGESDLKDVTVVLKNLMNCVDVKILGQLLRKLEVIFQLQAQCRLGRALINTKEQVRKNNRFYHHLEMRSQKKMMKMLKNSTVGTKIVSNEAHYFYPFVINPLAYKELIELGVTEGYTEEDYHNFRRIALVSATSFATNSKVGCENEFALFVETKADAYLPNLSEYIQFKKGTDKNIIKIQCTELLHELGEQIEKVDIYYNPHTTVLEGVSEDINLYDIRTQKEV